MSLGIIGKKVGMTRVFNDKGESVPVTVINVEPNVVAQVKTAATDGYNAIQVTTGNRKASKVNAPAAGHYKKAGVEAGSITREFRTDQEFKAGDTLEINMFEDGQKVRVTGTSKGKGFQGVIKRYNFHMQDATHGNSLSHRAPGSIGQCQTPGRVFKGKKMSGHMGDERVTTKNLEVVRVDQENNLILVKGAVPGAKTSTVIVRPLA
ncbi:50S ribosomal protein L3 [Marinicella sp. S1101]|uniref:50S ribosomal protein L3 n=1 Tax=Marinicella marina TaxID=2996016 RepID=UPI002260925C|nr:50S ribosomal protein L3 [Marinicella marina]MCX7555088.1 50S ribosomal protein L3 [Marinicella marina]MDJ1140297.1 50S ribosomal protein L3 [Marinicella marina]